MPVSEPLTNNFPVAERLSGSKETRAVRQLYNLDVVWDDIAMQWEHGCNGMFSLGTKLRYPGGIIRFVGRFVSVRSVSLHVVQCNAPSLIKLVGDLLKKA